MNHRAGRRGPFYAWLILLCSLGYTPSTWAWDRITAIVGYPVAIAALREGGDALLPAAVAEETEEQRKKRDEMAQMRRDLRELGGSRDAIRSAAVARRLATLEELRKKDLITAEEYMAKRRAIMEGP